MIINRTVQHLLIFMMEWLETGGRKGEGGSEGGTEGSHGNPRHNSCTSRILLLNCRAMASKFWLIP